MSPPRLTSTMLAGAIRRLAETQGGFAAVIAKGDETSGTILLQILEKGRFSGVFERMPIAVDRSEWARISVEENDLETYVDRRRRNDPDLWLIELDVPEAPRFIATLSATT